MSDGDRLELAIEAATHAAAVCRHVQSRLDAVRAITKDDKSPVTVADYASQAVIASVLREGLGAHVLVGEESADFLRDPANSAHLDAVLRALHESGAWPEADADTVLDAIDAGGGDPLGPLARAEGFWTLDPIDGTKGFLRGQQYSVSLSLVDKHGPRIGVLACPNLSPDAAAPVDGAHDEPRGCIFHAIRGEGAFQQHEAGPHGEAVVELDIGHPGTVPGEPLRLAESVESGHTDQSASSDVLRGLGRDVRLVRLDSQSKYALVARNQADVYLRLPTRPGYVERIWDHAAGALIALEAGCLVTDIAGKPLDFSRGRGLEANRGIVCAAADVHGAVVRAVQAAKPGH